MSKPSATVVIGAGYGDEGKGLLVDKLCSTSNSLPYLVVRFNGGAQAGHTVVTPSGRRHIFSHLGSGTLAHAATYLSKFFVVSPIFFRQEYYELQDLNPIVYVDPLAPVTTPYDIMINQALETSRGSSRHGSCGMGFGETLERQQYGEYQLQVRDLVKPNYVREVLNRIGEKYVPDRLSKLGLSSNDNSFITKEIVSRYIEDISYFVSKIRIQDEEVLKSYCVIFEGAQGLMLDMTYGAFPHVTRSNTGLRNVLDLTKGSYNLDVIYVSRWYVTRHGAGPLAHESDREQLSSEIKDQTNIKNEWQSSLRFAFLDIDVLTKAIMDDQSNVQARISKSLAITCLDQAGENISYISDGLLCEGSTLDLTSIINSKIEFETTYRSYGPTRDKIVTIQRPFKGRPTIPASAVGVTLTIPKDKLYKRENFSKMPTYYFD